MKKVHKHIAKTNNNKSTLIYKIIIWFSITLLTTDFVYKSIFGITYLNRENCIIYSFLPRWGFLIYEFFIELVMVVLAGIFVAVILEKYFYKMKKLYPKNSVAAFLYASLIPVCSCSAIPIVKSMENKLPFRAIITFIVAAPLLNPYIILLSFSVLGFEYGILRIVTSFILAFFTGWIVQLFYDRTRKVDLIDAAQATSHSSCVYNGKDVYESAFNVFKSVLPYLLIAGVLSVIFEVIQPAKVFEKLYLNDNVIGNLFVIVIGIPVYFCNGSDVIFLRPFIQFSGLPLGTAMSFSLTSTAVCISSIVLLIKFIGKKLTLVLLASVILLSFLIGVGINLIL